VFGGAFYWLEDLSSQPPTIEVTVRGSSIHFAIRQRGGLGAYVESGFMGVDTASSAGAGKMSSEVGFVWIGDSGVQHGSGEVADLGSWQGGTAIRRYGV
jgi:hypothetical protein